MSKASEIREEAMKEEVRIKRQYDQIYLRL